MTSEERDILIQQLDRIVYLGLLAKRCLESKGDFEANNYMIALQNRVECLQAIRKGQKQ